MSTNPTTTVSADSIFCTLSFSSESIFAFLVDVWGVPPGKPRLSRVSYPEALTRPS